MGLGGVNPLQLVIVLVLALLFFGGRGKISAIMGDLAKGVKSFRQGLKDDGNADDESVPPKVLDKDGRVIITPSKDKTKDKTEV